jgi:phenylalanyl-tRNA synthetase beta chain
MPPAARTGALTTSQHERRALRRVLAANGLSEAMPLPFLAPGDLERCGLSGLALTITNPLVAEESVLRTSLLPGLLKAVAYNASHRNLGVGLFEVGHVFRMPSNGGPLPDEREHVAVAVSGQEAPAAVEAWQLVADALAVADWSLEADVVSGLHPARTARVVVAGETVGAVGEVDPDVLTAHEIEERVAWRRFPSSDIDLAFEVDDGTPAAAVAQTLRAAAGELLARLELFDVYRGPGIAPGGRSVAFRLRLQALDRTLTDAEVAEVRGAAASPPSNRPCRPGCAADGDGGQGTGAEPQPAGPNQGVEPAA